MLTSAELCLLCDEIARTALPARIEKIHQPRADAIVFRLARGSEEHALLLALRRGVARAVLIGEPPGNPPTPPPFCEELRRLLLPGRIVGARTLRNDAVAIFDVEVKDATGPRRIVAELFGAQPNLLVLDESDRILAVFSPRETRGRSLVPGGRWSEPPPRERPLAPQAPFLAFRDAVPGATLSARVEAVAGPREEADRAAAVRDVLLADVAQEEKKLRRRLENIDADVRGADEIPRLRREGEILKANAARLKRGMKQVTLPWWDGEREVDVVIALDPKRLPSEEVTFRFDEARRLERLKDAASARRAEVTERLDALAAGRADAETAATEAVVLEVRARLGFGTRPAPVAGRKPAPKVEPRKPYRTFVSKDGVEILVGRTAADNDELTFRVANGNDFWLHVRNYPGSHVVIREREQIPEETLLDAATLAVHFSRAAAGGKHEVSWTRRKFVSKARKAPPGQVLLSAHKSLMLRHDPARLERLLRGRPGGLDPPLGSR